MQLKAPSYSQPQFESRLCNIWFRLFIAYKGGYYDKIVELKGESPDSCTLVFSQLGIVSEPEV